MAEPHPIPTHHLFQDLNGRVFGKLTVLFFAGRTSRKSKAESLWHCRCECGNERTTPSSTLTLGRAYACGYCSRHKPKPNVRSDINNLVGQTFGRLTVVSLAPRLRTENYSKTMWLCKCKCGEFITTFAERLTTGNTLSCGCLALFRDDGPMPTERKCNECGKTKPLTKQFFCPSDLSVWNLRTVCRACDNKKQRGHGKKSAANLRRMVICYYGGDPPQCQCPGCHEDHYEFMTIEHLDGAGAQHRKAIGKGSMYRWIVNHNFPSNFTCLCYNCNCSRGRYGYCPHQPQTDYQI